MPSTPTGHRAILWHRDHLAAGSLEQCGAVEGTVTDGAETASREGSVDVLAQQLKGLGTQNGEECTPSYLTPSYLAPPSPSQTQVPRY